MEENKNPEQNEKIVVRIDAELKDLIPGYIQNRYKDIEIMSKALESGDYETIRTLGHSMKGSGGGYGFEAITEIGANLEKWAKENNGDEIRGEINELSDYLKNIEIIYE